MNEETPVQGREAVELEEARAQKKGAAAESVLSEEAQARAIAQRLGIEYVDLHEFTMVPELFRNIQVELMFRYNFVPLHAQNGTLDIALSDPRNLNLIDELTLLLNKKLRVKVATLSQISELLKKTEQSQRVL